MDVIGRINQLTEQRGWSVYKLSLEAGITQSTLASMLMRKTPPKIDTLQSICDAFGITLSQFFLEDEQIEVVTKTEKELLKTFRNLPLKKQQALLDLLNYEK